MLKAIKSRFLGVSLLVAQLLVLSGSALAHPIQPMASAYLERGVLFVKCDTCTTYVPLKPAIGVDDFAFSDNTIAFRSNRNLYVVTDAQHGIYTGVSSDVQTYAVDGRSIAFKYQDYIYGVRDVSYPTDRQAIVWPYVDKYDLSSGVLAYTKPSQSGKFGSDLWVITSLARPNGIKIAEDVEKFRVSDGVVTYTKRNMFKQPVLYYFDRGVHNVLHTFTGDADYRAFRIANGQSVALWADTETLLHRNSGRTLFAYYGGHKFAVARHLTDYKVGGGAVLLRTDGSNLFLLGAYSPVRLVGIASNVREYAVHLRVGAYISGNGRLYVIPELNNWLTRLGPAYGQVSYYVPSVPVNLHDASVDQVVIGHDGTVAFLSAGRIFVVRDLNTGHTQFVAKGFDRLEVRKGVIHGVRSSSHSVSLPIDCIRSLMP